MKQTAIILCLALAAVPVRADMPPMDYCEDDLWVADLVARLTLAAELADAKTPEAVQAAHDHYAAAHQAATDEYLHCTACAVEEAACELTASHEHCMDAFLNCINPD